MAGDFELEAMSIDDCSWHPCQVYLGPNGTGLVIRDGNKDSEDILVSGKEALMRLRARSLPLQDDDCTRIKQGEHVVVNRNSQSESHFYDAEVEKVVRVRHSKRMQCRCTFMIKWLHQDRNGESLTVPSSSIKRLANESINDHPTISAFIEAVQLSNSSLSSMSQLPDVVNDIDLDLQELLEKQIEGIHNSVNGSKKKIKDESLGLEVGTNEQVKDTNISTSVQEELPENRSPLNPLAARAALASLMSNFSQSLEVSLNDKDGKSFTDFSEAAPEPIGIVKSLFCTTSPSDMSDVLKASSTVLVNRRENRHKKAEGTDFSSNVTQLRGEKVSPEKRTRLTRTTVRNVTDIPDDNIERSTTNKRLKRSVLGKEGERETTETTDLVEKTISSGNNKLITSYHKATAEGCFTSKDNGTHTEIDSLTTGLAEIQQGSKEKTCSGVMKKSSSTRRLTRSSVTDKTKTETMQESGMDEFTTDSPPSEQRNKTRTQEPEEDVVGDDGFSLGSKKKSPNLKGHEVRSSPRFHPKTRSQNKA